jgi:carbamoyl-phosphate synthase/aspartate carbamoyltransferase/dihydroorotase
MRLTNLPGLIDIHVHLRDPGQTHKEDFFTGTSAALAGGFTTVIDMPNNVTPITTAERLDEKIAIAREKTVCDIGFHFGTLGDNTDQYEAIENKAMGLKVYLDHTTGGFIIDRERLQTVFEYWPGTTPVLAHAEGEMIDLVIDMVKMFGKKAHIVHISARDELDRVIAAKEQGLPVTCGVCPHHLFLTYDDEASLKTYGLMKPRLKTREDVEYLWKHLDAIDVIESDHAPHTKEEKESESPPYGVPGLETTLPLLLRAEADGRLTREKLISLAYSRPAEIFRVPTDETTFIEVDEEAEYYIDSSTLKTKCGWTPFGGIKLKGAVRSVTLRGTVVYRDGEILAQPGSGTIISPR